jgi:hypothetical protein
MGKLKDEDTHKNRGPKAKNTRGVALKAERRRDERGEQGSTRRHWGEGEIWGGEETKSKHLKRTESRSVVGRHEKAVQCERGTQLRTLCDVMRCEGTTEDEEAKERRDEGKRRRESVGKEPCWMNLGNREEKSCVKEKAHGVRESGVM